MKFSTMVSIVAVPAHDCHGLIVGKDLDSSLLLPVRPITDTTRLQIKQLATEFFGKLARKRFESQGTLTIRKDGAELVEYALSGEPLFEIEAGSLDTVAHVYIQAEHADIQIIGGGMSEGGTRKLLMNRPPDYEFSTRVEVDARVECSEELCVALLDAQQLGLAGTIGVWLVFCDLNGYLTDAGSMELAMPEIVPLFTELYGKVAALLE
jgi:hypothetical protein